MPSFDAVAINVLVERRFSRRLGTVLGWKTFLDPAATFAAFLTGRAAEMEIHTDSRCGGTTDSTYGPSMCTAPDLVKFLTPLASQLLTPRADLVLRGRPELPCPKGRSRPRGRPQAEQLLSGDHLQTAVTPLTRPSAGTGPRLGARGTGFLTGRLK